MSQPKAKPHRIINGSELGQAICKAMDLDPATVERIIIDMDPRGVTQVYITHLGDERLLEIDWRVYLKESRIIHQTTSGLAENLNADNLFKIESDKDENNS